MVVFKALNTSGYQVLSGDELLTLDPVGEIYRGSKNKWQFFTYSDLPHGICLEEVNAIANFMKELESK